MYYKKGELKSFLTMSRYFLFCDVAKCSEKLCKLNGNKTVWNNI